MRDYFDQMRHHLSQIKAEFVVVASVATADGGKAGVLTEVTRQNAARLLVEGRATIANDAETAEYYARVKERMAAAATETLEMQSTIDALVSRLTRQ